MIADNKYYLSLKDKIISNKMYQRENDKQQLEKFLKAKF